MLYLFDIGMIGAFHLLATAYSATIPFPSSGLAKIAHFNTSSIRETVQQIDGQAHSVPDPENTTLETTQPWPPAPFDFQSAKSPGWSLNVRSYDTTQLTYRQKWALLSICTEYIKSLTRVRDLAKMPARTVVMVTDQKTPTDLSREDVEIAFFNSVGESGAEFRVGDTVEVLGIIGRTVVTGDMRELVWTVAHYAEARPVRGGRVFRRVAIRRKTDMGAIAIA